MKLSRRSLFGLGAGLASLPIVGPVEAAPTTLAAQMGAIMRAQFPEEFQASLPVTAFRGVNEKTRH